MLVFRRVIPTTLHPSWLVVFYHQFEKSAGQIGDDCPQIFGVKIQKTVRIKHHLLLMAEIPNNHLGCINKLVNNGR